MTILLLLAYPASPFLTVLPFLFSILQVVFVKPLLHAFFVPSQQFELYVPLLRSAFFRLLLPAFLIQLLVTVRFPRLSVSLQGAISLTPPQLSYVLILLFPSALPQLEVSLLLQLFLSALFQLGVVSSLLLLILSQDELVLPQLFSILLCKSDSLQQLIPTLFTCLFLLQLHLHILIAIKSHIPLLMLLISSCVPFICVHFPVSSQ